MNQSIMGVYFKEVIIIFVHKYWEPLAYGYNLMEKVNVSFLFLLFSSYWLPLCIVNQIQLKLFSFVPSRRR